MAVTTTDSAQLVDGARIYPIDRHGKLRMAYASAVQGAAAGDDGSQINLVKLPQGRKRLVFHLSKYKVSALGASRVMKVGHRAYYDRQAAGSTAVAEDDDAFMSGIDVSGATNAIFPITSLKYDMYSRDEFILFLTITGGTIPAAATFEFWFAYLYE